MEKSMFKFLFLVSGLFFATRSLAQTGPCDFLLVSPKVQATLSSLQSELQASPVWQNYRLSQNPVVLMELNQNQNCAVLLLNGKIVSSIGSVKNLKLANNAYAFIIEGQSLGSDELGDIPSELVKQNIKKALIWNLDFSWPPAVPQGLMLGIMAHEGFHLFVQGDKQNLWPQWPTAQGQFSNSTIRKELVQKCYNESSTVSSLADQELQHLIAAYRAVLAKDIHMVRRNLESFVQMRNLRYDLLKNVKVALNERTSISCQDLESSFEFNEGIPDYVSHATSLKSQKINFETLVTFIEDQYQPSKMKESYYAFGGLQLLSLSALDPKFSELQRDLLNSKSASEGVFQKVQERVLVK